MKLDILKEFNLPSYLKGKTFSEASKSINNKFKGRNDKISTDTKNELLDRLAQAQEKLKAELQIEQPQEQMFFGGDVDGNVDPTSGGIGAGSIAGAAGTAMGLADPFIQDGVGKSAASGAISGASAGAMFGPVGAGIGAVVRGVSGYASGKKQKEEMQNQTNNQVYKNNNKYSTDFAYGGKKYANGGPGDPKPKFYRDPFKQDGLDLNLDTDFSLPDLKDLINPRVSNANESGRRMPTTINVNPSLLTNKKQLGPIADETYTSYINNFYPSKLGSLKDPEFYTDPFSTAKISSPDSFGKGIGAGSKDVVGGKLGRPSNSGASTSGKKANDNSNPNTKVEGITKGPVNTSITGGNPYKKATTPVPGDQSPGFLKGSANKVGKFIKDNYADVLRYAPVLANAKQLADLEKPEYERLDRLSNRYEKDLADENVIANRVQQEADNTRNAITNASTGSTGALRSNLLGLQLNSSKALSDAMLQADNVNRGENRAEQQFNLNVDQTNLRQANLENDINARNKGVYESNKSALTSQLGTDIGNIGKEEKYKQMIEDLGLCYDVNGAYICGTQERVPEEVASQHSANEQKAMGGKVKNNPLFDDYFSVLKKRRNNGK